MSDAIVCVQGVTKRYAHAWALRGIEFEALAGRCLGLFGANGAGKTTLLKILATLTRPSAGSVSICGYDALRQPEKIRPLLGVLGHRTFLYGELSARENLRFYGRLFGVADCEARARSLLEAVGLDPDTRQLVRTYSRGMQQRVAIARVLMHQPPLLLLDEPFTGLDPHATARLQTLLQELRRDDHTIIFSTHDLARGLAVCDDILIQSRGKIVYQGVAADMDAATLEALYLDHVR